MVFQACGVIGKTHTYTATSNIQLRIQCQLFFFFILKNINSRNKSPSQSMMRSQVETNKDYRATYLAQPPRNKPKMLFLRTPRVQARNPGRNGAINLFSKLEYL